MDRNFDIDDFEQLLKERSDEFKMYPAKRVWYSIYNNIHPGRKWPSVATSVTLIAILLLVGYLNTGHKDIHLSDTDLIQPVQTASVNLSSSFYNPFLEKNIIYNQNAEATFVNNFIVTSSTHNNKKSEEIALPVTSISLSRNIKKDKFAGVNGNTTLSDQYNLTPIEPIVKNELITIVPINDDFVFETINSNKQQLVDNEKNKFTINDDAVDVQNKTNSQTKETQLGETIALIVLSNLNDIQTLAFNLTTNSPLSKEKDIALQEVNIMSDEDKAWVENYALYNKPAPKKWAGKLRSQMYITPSVVYRQLKNTLPTDQDINKEVTQHPSFGVELGAGILYPLTSWLKVKTGLQLNFTRYNANGFGNTHPAATSITMTTSTGRHYHALRSTPYSNNDGITAMQLHNETFQISLPVGMDVKLAGSETLQWNIGATIQPTYVIGGKSFLISSDKRNYIKESAMLNRWNLNAGFETFISYKTNGYTLQVGPQFRWQIFTTNKAQYSIQENLTNYGLKFGITKLIK